MINHLVKERGLTIDGARKKLKENPEDTLNNFEVVKRLQDIRQELIAIKEGLGENEN